MTLFGGMAAASLGGMAVAHAAQPELVPTPAPAPAKTEDEVAAGTKEGIDGTDAEFAQYYRRRRVYGRPRYYRRAPMYRRPRAYFRPRYARPRRRFYY